MSKPLSFFQDLARERYGREVVFVAQVGSLNYNLETDDSDEDYEVFLLPTFDTFYNRHQVSNDVNVDGVDIKFKEVPLLANQLVKSNPNFLQLLFSKNLVYCAPELEWMLRFRELMAASNTQRLYDSLFGMYKEALSRLKKSYEKDTLNAKALMQMHRVTLVIDAYGASKFISYNNALYLHPSSRRHCLLLKKGLDPETEKPLTREQVEDMVSADEARFKFWEDAYKSRPVNQFFLDTFQEQLQKSVEDLFFAQYKHK